MKQSTLAAARFGAVANAYLNSSVHAQGADLQRLAAAARAMDRPLALDLGCGAGHASFALANGGARVTACDVSHEMLAVVADEAGRRGLDGLQTRQSPAEALPFDDASFDLAATRFSAHHWTDAQAAFAEVRRVLRPGGTLIVIDAVAPEQPLFDTILQTVEILRDPSHVRDYRVSEWNRLLVGAGFAAPHCDQWKLRMEFDVWVGRMRTPPLQAQAIRELLAHAAEEARSYFQVGDDGSFDLDVAWMQTR
jgi:SAM-dependent methyltransferase